MTARARETATTPSASLAEIAVKARLIEHWLGDAGRPTDYRGVYMARGIIEDMERLAG
jgi:hypothetical protein